MIVYLMTVLVGATMMARAVLLTEADCHALAKQMIVTDGRRAQMDYTCEPLPMRFASVEPPRAPR
jgi:hypothetical protein